MQKKELAKNHKSHKGFYTNSTVEYFKLVKKQQDWLKCIDSKKIFAINSMADTVVRFRESMAMCPDIKKLVLKKSGHMVLNDCESEIAIKNIIEFIKG